MDTPFQGRRRPATAAGYLQSPELPGDYGCATNPRLPDTLRWWQVKAPDCSGCSLNPAVHTVEEHPDGTITVTPSIVTRSWHGWLRAGVWTSV